MVRQERISRKVPEPEIDPTGERFKLIEVYVQEPTSSTNEDFKVSARPYEFEGEMPSKYATSCPHCGQGIWFERYDIRTAIDKFFIACPECGMGITPPVAPMVDPFVNPVTEKIAETVLDPDLSKAQDPIDPDDRTVLEKLAEAGVDIDIESSRPEPSEIEQILDELEGKK